MNATVIAPWAARKVRAAGDSRWACRVVLATACASGRAGPAAFRGVHLWLRGGGALGSGGGDLEQCNTHTEEAEVADAGRD
jgi:hypothetical protein